MQSHVEPTRSAGAAASVAAPAPAVPDAVSPARARTLRMREATRILESCVAPTETIADEVGYEDAGFFGHLFKLRPNLTPAQYRRRFGAMRRALSGS
ncbi:hypothetical protein [Panacagrimonas sp.]|uniref:hypothetical protein n=1 Tax=Panacagrimonas sp. TaxID=2480088 RepID=UPI003B528007